MPSPSPASGLRRGVQRLAMIVLAALLPSTATASTTVDDLPLPAGIDVQHYRVNITPDIDAGTVVGQMSIRFVSTGAGQVIEFDRGALTVDAVRDRGEPQVFVQTEKRLRIRLTRPLAAGSTRTIELRYHGAPPHGLEFHRDRAQVYTIFSTSQWMVCIDGPDERATLDLGVVLPAGLTAIGHGAASRTHIGAGRVLHRWQQRQPVPSYVYGFAAGRFQQVTQRDGATTLRFVADGWKADDLRRVFADTADMLGYFGKRSGLDYAGDAYSQALVAETVGQELAGFTLLSDDYGRRVLATPADEALIAHEAAHQWWGNRVTCRDWGHFWLNEGFANFMAATYLEHRFGRDAYLAQVDGWRTRSERLRAAGNDHALVYAQWRKPSADDRAVVYQKSAYVLHLLREDLGDDAFWRGIRNYTQAHDGRSVTTDDFQRAMERSSGRDLSAFFARWVYSADAATAQAQTGSHR